MAISKLVAGAKGAAGNSTGAEIAETVNGLVDGYRKRIGFIVLGQSNESGRGPVSEMGDFPQAFRSIRNPSVTSGFEGQAVIEKIDGFSYGPQGAPWVKLYDELYDHGYECLIANTAIGSASWVNHAIGYVESHATNSNQFRARRSPIHPSDTGTAGTIIVESGKVFEMTKGTQVFTYLKNNGADLYVEGEKMPLELDYIYMHLMQVKN